MILDNVNTGLKIWVSLDFLFAWGLMAKIGNFFNKGFQKVNFSEKNYHFFEAKMLPLTSFTN